MLRRTAQVMGLVSATGGLVLCAVFVWFNPYTAGVLTLPIAVRVAIGLGGLFAAFKGWRFWMLVVFAASFLPLGLYLLGTPGIFKWIGISDLVYLVATLLLFVQVDGKPAAKPKAR